MSVQVDQITGVGTLVQTGDHVDVIIGFGGGTYGSQPVPELCGTGFVETTVDPKTGLTTNTPSTSATVKMVVQNTKVVGTLLPPPPATPAASSNGTTTTAPAGTSLNGQQEIVLMSVTAQQAEVLADTARSTASLSPPSLPFAQGLRRWRDSSEPGGGPRPDHGGDPQDPGRSVRRPAAPDHPGDPAQEVDQQRA